MPSEKATMILRKASLTNDRIAAMTEAAAWKLIYELYPPKTSRPKKGTEICFTGFLDGEKQRLEQLAAATGLTVVKSVTKTLTFLITGGNAGPSKLQKAQEQRAVILNEDQFMRFLDDGTIAS